jgi:hypothetical protein
VLSGRRTRDGWNSPLAITTPHAVLEGIGDGGAGRRARASFARVTRQDGTDDVRGRADKGETPPPDAAVQRGAVTTVIASASTGSINMIVHPALTVAAVSPQLGAAVFTIVLETVTPRTFAGRGTVQVRPLRASGAANSMDLRDKSREEPRARSGLR